MEGITGYQKKKDTMDLSLEYNGHLEVENCKDDASLRRAVRRWSRVHGPRVAVWVRQGRSPGGSVILISAQWWLDRARSQANYNVKYIPAERFLSQ